MRCSQLIHPPPTMSIVAVDMQNFGDLRGKDVYHRNQYHSVAAATAASAVSVGSTYFGVTAAVGSAHTANTPFQLASLNAVENTADGFESSLQLRLNSGATSSIDTLVANLSVLNSQFNSTNVTSNFGTSFTSVLNKGVGRDGTSAATVQTFNTGATGVASSIAASGDGNLYLKSTVAQVAGELSLIGNKISWAQNGGTAGYKKSTAGSQYTYAHNAGTVGTSTGVASWALDPLNVDGVAMASSAFSFNSYNSAGTAEEVLRINAGGAAGAQAVAITNAIVSIGQQPVAGQALSVTGESKFTGNSTVTGNMAILGNLNVTGTVETVNSTSINVGDSEIRLASGATASSQFNGGGLYIGQNAQGGVSWLYDDTLKAFTSSINQNIVSGKSYFAASGTNVTAQTGLSLSETGLTFGADTAALALGSKLTMNQNLLAFQNNNAEITIGTGAGKLVLNQNGISTGSDAAAIYFGLKKNWRVQMQTLNAVEYLSFAYVADGSVAAPAYVTKFSISP